MFLEKLTDKYKANEMLENKVSGDYLSDFLVFWIKSIRSEFLSFESCFRLGSHLLLDCLAEKNLT